MQIYFSNLTQLKDLLALMQLKPKKIVIMTNTSLIKFSLEQLKYLDVYTNKVICSQHVCALMQLCQCHLKLQMARRSSPFSWLFFSSNFLNYVAKDASIFHLKLDDNGRPN